MSHQMKARYYVVGAHVKVIIFTAPDKDRTFSNCGTLTFSVSEWCDAQVTLECGGVDLEAG